MFIFALYPYQIIINGLTGCKVLLMSRSPSPAPSSDPGQDPKVVDTPSPSPAASLSAGAWQAVFSPQHNAYYFYNASTAETTWVNPLQPSPSDPSSSSAGAQDTAADANGDVIPNPYDPNSLEARAIAAGIDPSLAHLDPSLAGPSSLAHSGSFAAKFNARTGAFSAADARAPSHLSEYERMKRMNEFYFDMGAWEKDVEQRDAEEKEGGKKRKRPTKKDLVSVQIFGVSFSPSSLFACIARDDGSKTKYPSPDGRTDVPALSRNDSKSRKSRKKSPRLHGSGRDTTTFIGAPPEEVLCDNDGCII